MTIRIDMLRAAARARQLLGNSTETVSAFACSQFNPDGGFKSRGEQSDLYYSVFGIELFRAIDIELPHESVYSYLRQFDIEKLDLVHLSSFVRCHANLADVTGPELLNNLRDKIYSRVLQYSTEDGGYTTTDDTKHGSVYGCFMAMSIFQDLKVFIPEREKLISCIKSWQKQDGSYANEEILSLGTTPATAAAVVALKYLGCKPSGLSLKWLLARFHQKGGFCAIAGDDNNNIPDLLSTATALHSLALNNVFFGDIKEKCLDFLDGLWNSQGGFAGNWFDTTLDCEYTYYGLLSLGHLSE